ncbi:MAG: DUF1887 family protein [Phaeodactylibacter sp.]|nr:DUF1887 family protein [Phaeodactylibacter sp.]MCB9286941.1 DUF1887 family protein [Lewinellaceae bacterium]
MANVLISLVGDQTVPNVFLIRDPAFRMVEEYVFVTTPLMEERSRLEHILASTGVPRGKYRKVCVEADNLTDIRERLNELQLPTTGNHYFVNLTSGTKVMSIAMYDYFTQPGYADCCSIFYVPIGKNAYLQVYPEDQRREEAISYRISLKEYLSGYGIRIEEQKGEGELHRPPEYTSGLLFHFQKAMDSGRPFSQMMNSLRNNYRAVQQKKEIKIPVNPELQAFLSLIRYPLPPDGCLNKAAAEYLIGGWLEEWAYNLVKERLGLPEEAIRYGVRVARPNAVGHNVPNECDLLFTFNNTLYIMECKTGLGFNASQLFADSIYKLTALRNEFGQRVEAVLLTLTNLRKRNGQWKERFFNRAQMHRVALFDRQGLMEELEEWLGASPQEAALKAR